MKIFTAIENYYPEENEICVFLAGGITNCPNWQQRVINELNTFEDTDTLCIFNPRRENFPIHDPNASLEQIMWEYKWLERMDIFSMYFCEGESDQPICMYELGRNILRMQYRFPVDWEYRIKISVENLYKRKQDVLIQTRLASKGNLMVDVCEESDFLIKNHANRIYGAYKHIVS